MQARQALQSGQAEQPGEIVHCWRSRGDQSRVDDILAFVAATKVKAMVLTRLDRASLTLSSLQKLAAAGVWLILVGTGQHDAGAVVDALSARYVVESVLAMQHSNQLGDLIHWYR